ncbi:hypothetical protein BGZ58_010362 [Dissophora ornata]|nr:hypothetical protein BGZ58_010362 [Dissophora ornata]
MGGSQPMGLQSIEALLHPQHRMTLEHLDIQCCIEIESKYIQLILTSCPSLRSFKSLSTKIGYVLYEPRLDIKDLPIRSGGGDPAWVCKGLRDLRIGFTGFSTLIEGESVNPYVDHIYGQLAVLTDLRILHLAGETSPRRIPRTSQVWAFDFTLESGLGKLKTLTKLKELNIQKLMHHRIAKAEIEWMEA